MNEQTAQQPKTEVAVFRGELQNMGQQFQAVLPQHIPLERFERVVLTAAQNNPDLLTKCSRRSLFNACMRAAQDGLLPDGREGAIVPFKGQAQWLPMVFGLRKKVRNSGEILDWDVQLVHSNDHFDCDLGSAKRIIHKPFLGAGERGPIVACYSIAHMKEGGSSIEIMSIAEVEAVRAQASRAKSADSPWQIPAYYPEMVRKTVARRHSKMLPMSSDLDDLIRRDDDLYEFDKPTKGEGDQPRRHRLGAALDALSAPDVVSAGEATTAPEQAEKTEGAEQQAENPAPAEQQKAEQPTAPKEAEKADKPKEADKPKPPKIPTTEAEYKVYAKGWIDASTDGTTEVDGKKIPLRDRWTHMSEKKLRNAANVGGDVREEIFDYMMKKGQAAAA